MQLRRRHWLWLTGGTSVIGLGLAIAWLLAPQPPPPLTGTLLSTPYRSQRLLALAAQEAATIPDVDTRLTRLLNLADRQIARKWKPDALATLTAAQATLGSQDAARLSEHARISGWIAISELARRGGDDALALSACDGAVTAMQAIEDPARRCYYVMGICNQLQYLKGTAAAAETLAKAGPWTREIDDVAQRRQAVVSFATALFNLDAYTAGQQLLAQEDDPAWRSDLLTQLASASAANATPKAVSAPQGGFYGRELNYDKVFQGQTNSQTSRD